MVRRIGSARSKIGSHRWVKIPVPLHPLVGVAYSLGGDLKINRWQDLQPYRIGVLRGVPFYDKPTQGMNRLYADDYKQLFELLVHDRVDVVVGTTFSSEQIINQYFSGTGISRDGAELIHIDTFHHLHRKHQHLVPSVTRTLELMRDRGVIRSIVQQDLVARDR